MPLTLELCDKYYGTKDVYTILSVAKNAPESEIKKAYYKLSLIVHPDRVEESEKEEATEKFKTLSKIYAILSDKDKRALYDEQGIIDDDDECSCNWLQLWKKFFKPISAEDISNYEKVYVGSETERGDIKKSYLNGKGCINYMMDHVQFMDCKDEPRIIGIVQEMIDSGEVPEYKICTEEPKVKRDRRHKKCAKEAQLAAAMRAAEKKKKNHVSLEQEIALKQHERERNFASLIEKFSNTNDDEENSITFEECADYLLKSSTKTKPNLKTTKGRKILKGRVSKH